MKGRIRRIVTAGVLFSAMALLCTGCIGYSEVTYTQGKMNIVSQYYEGSAEILTPLYTGDYEMSKTNPEFYQTKSSFETGNLQSLTISQEILDIDSLTFDGGTYVVQKASKIMSTDGQTIGNLTVGERISVYYFVEGLAIIPIEKGHGYVSRESLCNEDGTELPAQQKPDTPFISVQEQAGNMLLGNQHEITLKGEAIPAITITDSVESVVILSVDFNTLTIEGNTRVQLENCTGSQIIAASGAQVTLGENAVVNEMITTQTAEGSNP